MSLGVAGLIISAVGTGASIASAQEAKSDARKQRRAQEKQQRLQQRLSEARSRRQARIRRAQIQATSGAAGVTGSIVQAPLTGIESGVSAQAQLFREQGEIQREQFGIAESQTVNQANAAIAGALGSFAAEAFTPDATGKSPVEQIFGD